MLEYSYKNRMTVSHLDEGRPSNAHGEKENYQYENKRNLGLIQQTSYKENEFGSSNIFEDPKVLEEEVKQRRLNNSLKIKK